jgi:hypothetical protein
MDAMSSALAIVLTAAMAVPGNGPERVSGEMEQGLDLRGEWEGIWWHGSDCAGVAEWSDGMIMGRFGDSPCFLFLFLNWCFIKDEGDGRCLYENFPGDRDRLGIYEQDADRLVICIGRTDKRRPSSFTTGDDRHLLILHRVKPRK